jgi:hypothetical protein
VGVPNYQCNRQVEVFPFFLEDQNSRMTFYPLPSVVHQSIREAEPGRYRCPQCGFLVYNGDKLTYTVVLGLLGVVVGMIISMTWLRLRDAAFSVSKSDQSRILKLCGFSLPKDITEPLFEVCLGNERSDSAKSLTVVYSHKYSGLHEIGFVCEQRVTMPIKAPMTVGVQVRWWGDKGMIVYEVKEDVRLTELWFNGATRNGFSLVRYQVPDCVPIKKRLVCEIILSDLNQAEESYGPFRVYSRAIPAL